VKHDADFWKGFWTGRTIGVRLASLGVDAVSDWYLYNGVRLPDINTVWTDKEKYPYAGIFDVESPFGLLTMLVIRQKAPYIHYIENAPHINFGYSNMRFILDVNDKDRWHKLDENVVCDVNLNQGDSRLIWLSHDILDGDSVYFPASKPIPTT